MSIYLHVRHWVIIILLSSEPVKVQLKAEVALETEQQKKRPADIFLSYLKLHYQKYIILMKYVHFNE